jgi:hypothetical protein
VKEQLVQGGHSHAFAKAVAPFITAFLGGAFEDSVHGIFATNPSTIAEFDADTPTLFSGPKGTLTQAVRGFFGSIEEGFQTKINSLKSKMEEHPKWPGCSGAVPASSTLDGSFLQELFGREVFKSLDGGGKAWMRRTKNNYPNVGNSKNFLQGVGCLYFAKSGESFTVITVPLKTLIDTGVTMETVDKFMENDANNVVQKSMVIVHLNPWDLFYTPPGYATWCVHTELNKACVKHFYPGSTHIIHIPLALPLKKLDNSVYAYVVKTNTDYMDLKKGESTMWADRLEYFKEFSALD